MIFPFVGQRVVFSHLLLLKETRTGTITSIIKCHYGYACTVSVDFLPEDGPLNPPGKEVGWCLFYNEDPKNRDIPAEHWQVCWPL